MLLAGENESVSVRQCVNAREHLFAFSQSKRNPLIEYSAHNIMVRREERRRRNAGNENRLVVPVRGTTTCRHLTYCARRQCVCVCVCYERDDARAQLMKKHIWKSDLRMSIRIRQTVMIIG